MRRATVSLKSRDVLSNRCLRLFACAVIFCLCNRCCFYRAKRRQGVSPFAVKSHLPPYGEMRRAVAGPSYLAVRSAAKTACRTGKRVGETTIRESPGRLPHVGLYYRMCFMHPLLSVYSRAPLSEKMERTAAGHVEAAG